MNEKAQKASADQSAEPGDVNQLLVEKNRLLAAFHQIAQLTLAPLDWEKILDNLTEQIVESGIFRSLMVALVDEDNRRVEVVRQLTRYRGGERHPVTRHHQFSSDRHLVRSGR